MSRKQDTRGSWPPENLIERGSKHEPLLGSPFAVCSRQRYGESSVGSTALGAGVKEWVACGEQVPVKKPTEEGKEGGGAQEAPAQQEEPAAGEEDAAKEGASASEDLVGQTHAC